MAVGVIRAKLIVSIILTILTKISSKKTVCSKIDSEPITFFIFQNLDVSI